MEKSAWHDCALQNEINPRKKSGLLTDNGVKNTQVRHTITTLALALSEKEGWLQALGLLLSRPSLPLSCLPPFCFISVGQTIQLPWALSHGQEQQDHYLSYLHSGRKAPMTKSGFVNMAEFCEMGFVGHVYNPSCSGVWDRKNKSAGQQSDFQASSGNLLRSRLKIKTKRGLGT